MKFFTGLLLVLLSALVCATEPIPVTVNSLDKLWLPQQHNAPAQVVSLNTPELSAKISATVMEVRADVGDLVSKDDVLFRLDCENYRVQQQINKASLERSTAQLSFARSQLMRANNLKKKNSISDELLDQRRTELKVAMADKSLQAQNLALSNLNVDDCDIKAPMAGVVSRRMVSAGDYAVTGQSLVSLVDVNAIKVEAELRHAEIASLRQAATVFFGYENIDYALQLETVVPVFDKQTATAKARLVFNQQKRPWPGSEGRLKWSATRPLLPAEYISRRNDQLGVFHVVDGKAVFAVLDEATEGRPAIVDLPADAVIVIEGRHRLNDGDTVRVSKAD
jgi:RND family efflux transporter MFP subunit